MGMGRSLGVFSRRWRFRWEMAGEIGMKPGVSHGGTLSLLPCRAGLRLSAMRPDPHFSEHSEAAALDGAGRRCGTMMGNSMAKRGFHRYRDSADTPDGSRKMTLKTPSP